MARQLPFDAFVSRKISKWEARATELGIEFVDAVGVSPVEEMIYFWNGYKKMRGPQLEYSLAILEATNQHLGEGAGRKAGVMDADESAILAVLKAVVLGRLNRVEEARQLLSKEVLGRDWIGFKGGFKDNWTLPVANYEMGVFCWWESGKQSDGSTVNGSKGRDKKSLLECAEWVDKVAKWESYDLDARYVFLSLFFFSSSCSIFALSFPLPS